MIAFSIFLRQIACNDPGRRRREAEVLEDRLDLVIAELAHERTPAMVQAWLSDNPSWPDVQAAKNGMTIQVVALGLGEQAAIALAEELSADALLIDRDRSARNACPPVQDH
jgi:predicted nucleic acid-binding protein